MSCFPKPDEPITIHQVAQQIARDIGQEAAEIIEVFSTNDVEFVLSSFFDGGYSEIIANLEEAAEEAILIRLQERARFRKKWRKSSRRLAVHSFWDRIFGNDE